VSRTVLIVEDTDTCSDVLEVALLAVPDIHIQSAATAEEALEYLDGRDVCALITDLNLPRMDGFELIERVRGRSGQPRVPILVISGDTDPRTPERVRHLGADAFFTKPYSPGEVRQKLEQLIHGT
jgi:two-component system, chemotaxis family, chemotaxis protein CheY